jgi:hypothetical protein
MNMRIEPLGDGKYKLAYEGRSPYPANPYTFWWSCLRQEANGRNWEYRLTKQEVLQRLEKEL